MKFMLADEPFLPAVCAKTGRPTDDFVPVHAYRRPPLPAPARWLWAAGAWPGSRRPEARLTVRLPFNPAVGESYRRWRWGVVALAAAAAALVALGATVAALLVPVGSGVACLAALAWWGNLIWHTCAVSAGAGGSEVEVSRCHPAFRDAVGGLSGKGLSKRSEETLKGHGRTSG